jgi:hypothetical protein
VNISTPTVQIQEGMIAGMQVTIKQGMPRIVIRLE